MAAAKVLQPEEFSRGFAFRDWRERVCDQTQEEIATASGLSLATIRRIEQDAPNTKQRSFELYAKALGTTLAEIDALLLRLNAAGGIGGGTLREPEIGATRALPTDKESPAMHSRNVRLLEVELDYMKDAEAEALLERLQTMRERSGRASPGRAQSRSSKKR